MRLRRQLRHVQLQRDRRQRPAPDLVTSIAFGKRWREMGVRPSTGSVDDAYDNAMAESFCASLECELMARSALKH